MLKTCSHCGGLHKQGQICPHKKRDYKKQRGDYHSKKRAFRSSAAWRKKAAEIKERDNHLCQACLNKLPATIYQYNYKQLSVHHIISLEDDYKKRLDNDNLITLCAQHHWMADNGEIKAKVLRGLIDTPPA